MLKKLSVAVLALLLTSCNAPGRRPTAAHGPVPSPFSSLPSGARLHRIDANQSELRVLVYRSGPMAHFGHNHVMVNHAVQGWVHVANEQTASSFSLTVPAAAFGIDSAQSRKEEGPEFPGEIPDDAKTGTLNNMLSPALLNAANFSAITIDSAAVSVGKSGLVATLVINVAGRASRIEAPFTLQSDSNRLSATGSFELRQTDLGLTPFTLLLGALQVEDTMRVKFKFVAVAS